VASNESTFRRPESFKFCSQINPKPVNNFYLKAQGILADLTKQLADISEKVVAFNLRDIMLGAQEFLTLTSKVNKLVNFTAAFNKVPEPEVGPEDFDWLFLYVEPEPIPEPILPKKPVIDTKLIDLEKELPKLEEWFDGKKLHLEKIYRGSEDGFLAENFHKLCDSKSPTLTVVESSMGKKFGGYTLVPWSSEQGWKEDLESFVFSLSHQTKHPIKQDQKEFCIGHNKDYLPFFGYACEFSIYPECNNNPTSWSNIGRTYEAPEGIVHGSEEAKTYMAGEHKFQVKDIEVFIVSFPPQ
jgi:hypothetical protein